MAWQEVMASTDITEMMKGETLYFPGLKINMFRMHGTDGPWFIEVDLFYDRAVTWHISDDGQTMTLRFSGAPPEFPGCSLMGSEYEIPIPSSVTHIRCEEFTTTPKKKLTGVDRGK